MLTQIEEHFHVLPLGEKSLDFGKILSTETSVKILEALYSCDTDVGVSASQISESLGLGRTTVIYHLGRMQESGLIRINPILKNDKSWNRFWNLYRQKSTDFSPDQFGRVHTARMNGVKLYVPTKKGFLLLPSASIKESRSMVRDVLESISQLALEDNYQRMKKASSIMGTLGVLFIALSLAFQMPFLQLDSTPETSFAPSSPLPAESLRMEKSVGTAAMYADSAQGLDAAPEDDHGGESEIVEETAINPMESETPLNPEIAMSAVTESAVETPLILRLLFYIGLLFTGSFIGFLAYTFIRKK